MNAREQIEKELGSLLDGRTIQKVNRIREILAKHELVPIDNTEEAKETVTDSIIKKLEVYIENNGTVAPFLQSEKDDIRLEVLDEVGKLEEENAAHVSLLKTYSERIAGLEDKLRWRDCKTEPPTESGWYLMRWNYEEESHGHRIAHFLADKDRTNPNNKPCAWLVGTNRQPDQWRPIE